MQAPVLLAVCTLAGCALLVVAWLLRRRAQQGRVRKRHAARDLSAEFGEAEQASEPWTSTLIASWPTWADGLRNVRATGRFGLGRELAKSAPPVQAALDLEQNERHWNLIGAAKRLLTAPLRRWRGRSKRARVGTPRSRYADIEARARRAAEHEEVFVSGAWQLSAYDDHGGDSAADDAPSAAGGGGDGSLGRSACGDLLGLPLAGCGSRGADAEGSDVGRPSPARSVISDITNYRASRSWSWTGLPADDPGDERERAASDVCGG